jgi:hypothetical protein
VLALENRIHKPAERGFSSSSPIKDPFSRGKGRRGVALCGQAVTILNAYARDLPLALRLFGE